MDQMKETCLHDRHVALGALMSPFGGFDMPIQYKGIVEEHNAVRNEVGVFDVSHMGEVLITGDDAEKFINYIFTNDLTGAPDYKIYYGMMLNPQGGCVDDCLVYKRNDKEFFMVPNAANIDKDIAWIREQAKKFNVHVNHMSHLYGELAVQGPKAEDTLREVLGVDCSDLEFYTFKDVVMDGEDVIISRTGYTGEDGFEIYASHTLTQKLWDKLMAAGVQPCGLGCRDTLRFEAGLPLYGDELTDDITPIEAGFGMFVKLDKPDFIGKDVNAKQKAEGPARKLVGLEVQGQAIPRHGYEVLNQDDEVIGEITTGYHSITLDKNLAFALVKAEYSKLGTELKVKVRRKTFPAIVVKKRFYTPNYKK
ncbi:MAG: glycine cleavage system aminomethyltransferase GcvT [Bacteroidales bacterium]|nr:glycine cleavage system aminomethyltransferase GcvT [Bacteroidales bacterium]